MTTNSLTRLTTAIATGAVLLSTIAPVAFADSTLNISGNGSASTNGVTLNNNQTNTVVQTNTANVTNSVTTSSDTGHNSSNDNTGGTSYINTGAADTSVRINNQLNDNEAQVSNCGCTSSTDVTVGGNGSFARDNATVNNNNTANVFQTNTANVRNTVDTTSTTGSNTASRNTGGDTSIVTGPAVTDVHVDTAANRNVALVGGTGTGAATGGTSSLRILGNGSASDNGIALNNNNSAVVTQTNDARIVNDVTTRSKTGFNDANDNTDGGVYINTGGALTGVRVSNEANFNAAALDCGCMSTVTAKEEGNGSYSRNGIAANLGGTDSAFQTGDAYLSNPVDTHSYTGANDENRNTGGVFDPLDPSLYTGDSSSWTTVNNAANENVYGPEAMFTLPNGQQMAVNFNMGDVLSFFHMM